MGTRSLTRIWENWKDDNGRNHKTCVVAMYRQYDGHLFSHGKELQDFLKDMQICNGISDAQNKGKWANGMGCLAAQMVAHFKEGIGGFYLMRKSAEQEYTYDITLKNDELWVKVEYDEDVIYKGLMKCMPIEDDIDE